MRQVVRYWFITEQSLHQLSLRVNEELGEHSFVYPLGSPVYNPEPLTLNNWAQAMVQYNAPSP